MSFDGAWQKRGTGRGYNSLTGHASLFGEKTKKILSFSSRSKRCRICSSAIARGVPPRKHNCRCNWQGSAKAMEPSMACEMLTTVQGDGAKVGTFVMDNDSTTIAKVKATVSPNIEKRADRNHTKKGFTGALLELGNTHKLLKNPKLRSHIERCFTYCIQQNRVKPNSLKLNLAKLFHIYMVSIIVVGLGVEVSKPITNPRTCPMESLSPVVYFEQLWKPSSISMPVRQRSLR